MSKKKLIAAGFFTLATLGIMMPATTGSPAVPQKAATRARLGATAAAAAIEWSAPVTLSRTAFHSTQPTLSLDAKGQVYAAWTEWTGSGWGRNMMFATNAGGAWGPAIVVAPLQYDAIDDVGFPTVAATPSGSAYVAYHDGDMAAQRMIIRGALYANGIMGPVADISQTTGPTSYVVLGISPLDESLFGMWMEDTGTHFDLGTRYRDGKTGAWTPTDLVPVMLNTGKYTYQVNHIAFDLRGKAHAVFQTRYNKAQVWYTGNPTPKNLAAWTEPFLIAPDTRLSDVLPRVQADKDGDAYVVWHEMVNDNEEVLFRRTVNGVWQATENLSHSAAASENPSIAVDPDSKEIFIVWQEQVNASNWDVFMNSYMAKAGGADMAWTGPVNMTNSPGRTLEPNIAAMPGGDLYLVYQDDISGSGGRAEILFSSKVTPPKPKLQAPLAPALKTTVSRILFASRKANVLSFAPNAANDATTLQEYRIYRRKIQEDDDAFVLLAALDLGTFGYKDANLITKQKYAYRIGVVNKDGDEKLSDIIAEK
jgi:hypothetical protein